jgi:putative Holliday junction resolvase
LIPCTAQGESFHRTKPNRNFEKVTDPSTPPPRPRGALLALDVGDVRIGVAVSESRIIASPLDALDRRRLGRSGTLDALQALVDRYRVTEVLLGLPLLEGGREGEQAEKTRAFGRSLQRRIPGLAVTFRDERYTTSEARGILGPGPHPPGKVDSLAAAILLEEVLGSGASAPDSG